MEEYLQYMRTLRSQMNDVEDQAAKISVEEQMQITTIQTLTKEIDLAKSEKRRLKEEADVMLKAKGLICSKLLEKQRKIAALENDSSSLSQTLELIQQERANLTSKLLEKRTCYRKTEEEIKTKLKEQQEWLKHSSEVGQRCLSDVDKATMVKLDAAKAKFDLLTQMRSGLASESCKVKQTFDKLKCRLDDFRPELRNMLSETLEEELQALSFDKSAETEYLQSLKTQIETVKGIPHLVRCACGEEYRVEGDVCA